MAFDGITTFCRHKTTQQTTQELYKHVFYNLLLFFAEPTTTAQHTKNRHNNQIFSPASVGTE